MKKIIIKILFGLLGLALLFLLVYFSFSSSTKTDTVLSHNVISGMGAFQKTPHMLDEGEDMSIQSLDGYTTVYSDRNDYIVDATDPSTTIVSVPNEEGNYLFDAKSGEKALLIQTDLYTVEMKKGGMLYLFHDGEKVTVSSFNTVARVAFVQKETQEQTSHTYVYPHMYFQFDTAIFTGKKELDSLRIAQLGEIGYFSENFGDIQVSQSSGEVSDGANIPFVRNEKSRLFIQKALKKMTEKHGVYAGKIQEIQSSSMTPFLAGGYIEKYFNFLYNPEKKSLYYKNTILNNTLKLLSDAEYDNKTIQTIKKDLETLKTLDGIGYEQMSSIIETIYFYSLHDFTEERQAIRSVLQSILFEGKGVEDNSQLDMLQYHMDLYNFVGEQSVYAFLQDNIYITKADVQDNMYEYYALFLRKMIEEGLLARASVSDLELSISLLQAITSEDFLQKVIRKAEGKTDQEQYTIATNIDHLRIGESLEKAIQETFFDGRGDNRLLNKSTNTIQSLASLQKAVANIELFYRKNQTLLKQENYTYLIDGYESLFTTFEEYFSALANYTLYQKDYSKSNKKLLGAQVYTPDSDVLGYDLLEEYLSQFDGVDIFNITMTVIDEFYYDITNINIGGRNFSLQLSPYEGNRVTNITLLDNTFAENSSEYIFYDELQNITLDLDVEQAKYEKLFSKAKEGEKQQYDFSQMFRRQFFPAQKTVGQTYVGENYENKGKDDEVISVFKSAKLLGNKGEFKILEDVLYITYDDLDVKKFDDTFSISILQSELSLFLDDPEQSPGYADMSASYELEGDNHYFFDVKISPYIMQGLNKISLVGDNQVSFIGNIELQDFTTTMETFFIKLLSFTEEYEEFMSTEPEEGFKITYNVENEKISIIQNNTNSIQERIKRLREQFKK